jgi:FkbM family methyltransferase
MIFQVGQSQVVDEVLHQKTNGFFVECGAGNGEALSNTLFLERHRNWSGLLIEADPDLFDELLAKNRNSYSINACLSPGRTPKVMQYTNAGTQGGITSHMQGSHMRSIHRTHYVTGSSTVQCFPLLSILKAIGVTHVDYFSLDTEGSELDILKSLPFSDIVVDLISVEYKIIGNPEGSRNKLGDIKHFMARKHYEVLQILSDLDIILQRNVHPANGTSH